MPEKDDGLPVATLREAIPYLRRPFMPEAVNWKIQTVFKEAKGCIVVGYIDARLVQERLNMVLAEHWRAEYQPVEGKATLMWCHLLIRDGLDNGLIGSVARTDVGEGQGATDGMRMKAAVSDSLKRAAVHFGVGVSIYALPQITLFPSDAGLLERFQGSKGPSLRLTEKGHVKLREGYAKWLDEHGKAKFGDPLDHGDVEGDTFDPEAEAEFTPAPAPALDDAEAIRLQEEARGLYEDAIDKTQLPPARFNAWVAGAAHSHEEMQRLVDHLRERAVA